MINLWNQPAIQGFFDQEGKLRGAIELIANYHLGKNFSANKAFQMQLLQVWEDLFSNYIKYSKLEDA